MKLLLLLLTLVWGIGATDPPSLTDIHQLGQVGEGRITAVEWSPDGRMMAVGGSLGIDLHQDGSIDHLDTAGLVQQVRFSPDGRWLVAAMITGSGIIPDYSVQRWDLTTGDAIAIEEKGQSPTNLLGFDPTGHYLVSHRSDQGLQVWDIETGQIERAIRLYPLDQYDLSPGFETLLISNHEQTRILDFETGELLYTLPFKSFAITRYRFSPDGRLLAISIHDRIHLFEARTGHRLHPMTGQSYSLFLEFSPDGRVLASGGNDNTVYVWDTATGQPRHILEGQDYSYSLAFSPDGQLLAVGSRDRRLRVWEVTTGRVVRSIVGHRFRPSDLGFSPGGDILRSRDQRAIYLWEMKSGTLAHRFEYQAPADFLLTDEDRLVVQGANGTAIWQWVKGEFTRLQGLPPVGQLALDPDGKLLATGDENGRLRVWDTDTGQPVYRLAGHTGRITGVTFSPDGAWLVSSGLKTRTGSGPAANADIRLWDMASGRLLSSHETEPWGVSLARFVAAEQVLGLGHIPDSCGRAGGSSGIFLWSTKSLRSAAERVDPLWMAGGPSGASLLRVEAGKVAVTYQSQVCLQRPTVEMWDLSTGQQITSWDYEAYVTALALHPDGSRLAIGLQDGRFELLEVETGMVLYSREEEKSYLTSLAYNRDGRLLAAGKSDGAIVLWDGVTRHSLTGHTGPVTRLRWNKADQLLLSLSDDGTIRVWGPF